MFDMEISSGKRWCATAAKKCYNVCLMSLAHRCVYLMYDIRIRVCTNAMNMNIFQSQAQMVHLKLVVLRFNASLRLWLLWRLWLFNIIFFFSLLTCKL